MDEKFGRKLYAGLFVFFTAVAIVLIASIFSLQTMITKQRKLIEVSSQERMLAGQLRSEMENQYSLMPIYVLSADSRFLKGLDESRARFSSAFSSLSNLSTDPESATLLKSIKMAAPGEDPRPTLDRIVEIKTARHDEAKQNMQKSSNRIINALIAASVIAVVLAFVSTLLCVKFLHEKKEGDERRDFLLKQESRLSEARKEAVEVVAHDLRGPLASISMAVDLIAEEIHGENSEVVTLFGTITRSISSMQRLIDDILDHTKIESGKLLLTLKDCNLQKLVDEVVERFHPLAHQKSILIKEIPAQESVIMRCDSTRLEQAISNILSNAIKFTPQNGSITVETQVNQLEATLLISDTGPGIPKEQLDRVFDRYWQVRTGPQGAGLGLAIVKGIVEAHGGRVEVESELGSGSRFVVHLPHLLRAFDNPPQEFAGNDYRVT